MHTDFNNLIDVPRDLKIIRSIVLKRLQSGFFVEVFLAMRDGHYQAALFINDKFKAGPPMPQPLDNPTEENSHWMGVRPSVGLSSEEADKIISEVEYENFTHHKKLQDRWGKNES